MTTRTCNLKQENEHLGQCHMDINKHILHVRDVVVSSLGSLFVEGSSVFGCSIVLAVHVSDWSVVIDSGIGT